MYHCANSQRGVLEYMSISIDTQDYPIWLGILQVEYCMFAKTIHFAHFAVFTSSWQ